MAPLKNKKNYCTIYIVRHGETEWNIQRRLQGHADSPLTPKGTKQAKLLRKKFKNIKFNAIFSSDSLRAKRSAEIIALEHKLAVKTTKALRERSFGSWEGKTVEEFNVKMQKMLDKYDKLSEKHRSTFKIAEDVETNASIMVRLITFLREIAVAYAGKTVLIVTHGGTMREFLIRTGYATHKELSWGAIGNMAHAKLLCDGVDFFIKEVTGVHKSTV